MRLSYTLGRVLAVLLLMYGVTIGGTFNGVIGFSGFRFWTLGILAIMVVLWFIARKNWVWHTSPFDLVFVLWGVAFGASIVANSETWRRSAEALWFMALYIALWYWLADVLSNGVKRTVLIDALLIVGAVLLVFGVTQVWNGWQSTQTFVRPVSTIGNPNAFGAFLVVLLPFSLIQILFAKRRFSKIVMGLYSAVAIALLLLTFSRGAWVGWGVGLGVMFILALAYYDLLGWQKMRVWWQTQPASTRGLVRVVVVGGVAFFVVMVFALWQSLSLSGRGADLRTLLWEYAWGMFTEQPLTGQGLFTYGYHLPLYWSIPPQQPHSHAHNAVFQVLAELGILGTSALVLTVWVAFRQMRHNWQIASATQKPALIASYGALVGFGVHHLLDLPAMMPIIAILGLLVFAISTVPLAPQHMMARWRVIGHPVGMGALWVILIGVGLWQSGQYDRYFSALQRANEGFQTESPTLIIEGANQLEALTQNDPYQPANWLQMGYLLGIVADEDTHYLQEAVRAYERYTRLEPNQASGWANLASLQWQMGDEAGAQKSIAQAVRLAPDWQFFQRQQAIYTRQETPLSDIVPPESIYSPNMARFQFLRDIFTSEMLPQTGRAE